MQHALPTPRSSLSPLFVDDVHPPSLYIPHVPRRVSVYDILSQIGDIESVDWIPESPCCFVHFSVWYDTPVAEELYSVIAEGRSYRLYDDDSGKFVICRANQSPVPRYRGSLKRDYFIAAIRTLETAHMYGSRCPVLTPKHIRFDEHSGTPTVVEYFMPGVLASMDEDFRNIHQLAAEYEWWIQTFLQHKDCN
jgi:hypothetical protein